MYSTPASAIAAIMASPLSSAGTSTQVRLSLRSDPACLFMAVSLALSLWALARRNKPHLRPGGRRLRSAQGGRAHEHDAPGIDRWLADGAVATCAGAAQPVTPDHHRGADRRRRRRRCHRAALCREAAGAAEAAGGG